MKYLDYFFVLRPTLFFPVWTVFLAGYHAAVQFAPGVIPSPHPLPIAILLSILMGAVFIFNQLADIETDRRNQKLFFIANGIIDKKTAITEAVGLTCFCLAIALWVNVKLGIAFALVFFFTGVLYSFGPFSWKDRPILGIINNFLGGWSVAVCGWLTAGSFGWRLFLHGVPYALGLVAVFLLTTLPDVSGDRAAGKITFGVKYGTKAATRVALMFEFFTIVSAWVLKDYVLLVPAIMALPLFILAAYRQTMSAVLRAIKFTVLFASLAVVVIFPWYFLLILVMFYFSKWYYRKRFNLEYPSFAA